jgi:hypothetical protein
MKKLLLIAFVLLPFSSFAQLYYSDFALENEAITHVEVFEPADTTDLKGRLIDMLSLTTGIKNIQDRGNYIIADIEGMNIDYKKHGGKTGWLPMIATNGINGRIRVDIKNGRYRTSITSIEFISSMDVMVSGVNVEGSDRSLDEMVLNRDRTDFKKSNQWNKVMFYMNKDFTDKFTLSEPIASEDW